MVSLRSLEIGLSFLFGFVLLGLVAELYYLLWWKKRKEDLENQNFSSSKYTPTNLSSYISCFKTPNSSKIHKTHEEKQDSEMGLGKDLVLRGVGEESLDLELMRLHNLCGPPRFLSTINEETKEDLEAERSKKGSRTRSLSDLLVTLDSPSSSPPLKGLQKLELEGYNHHGLNPLFEMRSSPPPTFKFLRDAEEKLLRRLMNSEVKKDEDFATKMEDKDGFFVNFVVSKGKSEGGIHTSSQVLPLASSPSTTMS